MITMEENGRPPKSSDWSEMYESKRRFVERISTAVTEALFDVEEIEYDHPSDHKEYVIIRYCGGHKDIISVHMNSHTAIGMEIFRQLSGEGAHGLCRRLSR